MDTKTESLHSILVYNPPWAGPVAHAIVETGEKFYRGQKIARINPNSEYELEVDKQATNPREFPPLDFYYSADGTLFFSRRLRDFFDKLGINNIDYFSVKVTYKPTNTDIESFSANVIGIVDCVDYEKSKLKQARTGRIRSVDKLVLSDKSLRDFQLVRSKEFPTLIIVNNYISNKLAEENFLGLSIVEPENWEAWMI